MDVMQPSGHVPDGFLREQRAMRGRLRTHMATAVALSAEREGASNEPCVDINKILIKCRILYLHVSLT